MGRLFWTFPDGRAGAGLLLLRVTIGGVLLARGLPAWPAEPSLLIVWSIAAGVAAAMLLAGIGTPVLASAVAAVEAWRAYSDPANLLVHLLLAIVGLALALLGPGAFSLDASIFGWRRIGVADTRGRRAAFRTVSRPASKGPDAPSN